MLQLWNNLAIEHNLPGLYIISTIGNFYEEDKQTITMTKNVREISGEYNENSDMSMMIMMMILMMTMMMMMMMMMLEIIMSDNDSDNYDYDGNDSDD